MRCLVSLAITVVLNVVSAKRVKRVDVANALKFSTDHEASVSQVDTARVATLGLDEGENNVKMVVKNGEEVSVQKDVRQEVVATKDHRIFERASKASSAYDLGEIAKRLVIRKCMTDYAKRWPTLRNKYGFHLPMAISPPHVTEAEGKAIVEAVEEVWEITDLIENRIAEYNFFKSKIATKVSDKVRDWTELREWLITSLRASTGLKYERLEALCRTWGGDDSIDCMRESAGIQLEYGDVLVENVEKRKELEDFTALAFPDWDAFHLNWEYPGYNEHIGTLLDKAKSIIKKNRFSYSESLKTCTKKTLDDAEARLNILKENLQDATEKSGVMGKCVEKSDQYCGEGYSPATKLEFNKEASLTTMLWMQPGSYALMCIAVAVQWTLPAIATGPAGMAAAALAGCGIGIALPGNTVIAAGSGILVGALTSSFDCGCYPRECAYDEELQQCMIGGLSENPSKNPYARALPGQGLKCVPYTNSKIEESGIRTCRYESCTADDYSDTSNDYLKSSGLRGRIGRSDGGGLLNCLSKEINGGYMMLEAELPQTGERNTAVYRSELLRQLRSAPGIRF